MSVNQAPSKGSTLAVAFVRLIVQHLDYAKLMALSATSGTSWAPPENRLAIALEERLQQTLATLIGHSLLPQQIQVQLQPGSVLVDARVVDPSPAQIRHFQSDLNTTSGFEADLRASILGISGIQAACTGPVAVTNVEAGVEEATRKSSDMTTRIIMVSSISLMIGFVLGLGMLIVAASLLGRSQAPSVKPAAQREDEPTQLAQLSSATMAMLASSASSDEGLEQSQSDSGNLEGLLDTVVEIQQPPQHRHPSAPAPFVPSLHTICEADPST